MKKAIEWMFANRKKEAHYLLAIAGAIATTWSTSEAFRNKVTSEVAMLPHAVQGFIGLLTFAVPIWMAAKKIMANEGGAE